jgi:hypothetical protein
MGFESLFGAIFEAIQSLLVEGILSFITGLFGQIFPAVQ